MGGTSSSEQEALPAADTVAECPVDVVACLASFLLEDIVRLVVEFAAMPPGDCGSQSRTYKLGGFLCPTMTRRMRENVHGRWVQSTLVFVVRRNVAFVSGVCSLCNGTHLLRRDLQLSADWTMVLRSTSRTTQPWLAATTAPEPCSVRWAREDPHAL